MKTVLLTILTFIGFGVAYAQDGDTIVPLPEVEVVDRAIQAQREIASKTIRSIDPGRSLAELLQIQNGFYIKSQGVGALSTLTYKGLSGMHIPVSINGFLLQSSMNGLMDLSLIPSFHFSQIATGERKDNDVGGLNLGPQLNLDNRSKEGSQLMVGSSSLLNLEVGTSYSDRGEKLDYKVSAYGRLGKNRIHLGHYGENRVLSNTAHEHWSVMQTSKYQLTQRSQLQNLFYYQFADRQIASSLHTTDDAKQKDVNLLFGTRWIQQLNKNNTLIFSNVIWKEQIVYRSEQRNMDFPSNAINSNSQLSFQHITDRGSSLQLGAANEVCKYEGQALQQAERWSRWRLNATGMQHFGSGQLSVNYSALFYKDRLNSMGDLKYRQSINDHNSLSLRLSKAYRLPTMNELYWFEPGYAVGNENLLPEKAYRADLYWSFVNEKMNQSVNLFYGDFEDRVQWRGYPQVRPENVDHVQTFGLEYKLQWHYRTAHVLWIVDHNQHWVRAKEKAESTQLIYTPLLTTNLTLTAKLQNAALYVNAQYLDRNYYSSDNLLYLSPYALFELGAYRQLDSWRLGVRVGNVTNAGYFSIPQRPQAGTTLHLNINYIIKTQE